MTNHVESALESGHRLYKLGLLAGNKKLAAVLLGLNRGQLAVYCGPFRYGLELRC